MVFLDNMKVILLPPWSGDQYKVNNKQQKIILSGADQG